MRVAPLLLLLVVVGCVLLVPRARAQSMSPGASSGSVLGQVAPTDGPALSAPRWNLAPALFSVRRWLRSAPSPDARLAARPSLKARRAVLKRNPFWVP
jgi:hypothetical protein